MQPPTRQRGSVSVQLVEKEYITLYKITTESIPQLNRILSGFYTNEMIPT